MVPPRVSIRVSITLRIVVRFTDRVMVRVRVGRTPGGNRVNLVLELYVQLARVRDSVWVWIKIKVKVTVRVGFTFSILPNRVFGSS